MLTTDSVPKTYRASYEGFTRRGDGQGRRHARPEPRHDARGPHDGRRLRAGAALRAAPRRGGPDVQPDPRRRLDVHQRHRGRPGLGDRGAGLGRAAGRRARRGVRVARAPDGGRRRRRDADRDGLGGGRGERPPGARRGARGRRLAARQVLAQRRGPLLGPRRRRAGRGGGRLRARPRRPCATAAWPSASGARAWTTTALRSPSTSRAATSKSTATSGSGRGRGSVLCCDLGPGYLDENRTTS